MLVLAAFPVLASASGISTEMSGAEVKNSAGGDVDALATLHITSLSPTQGKLCFKASWTRLDTVTGLYVYEGRKGATGKQVLKLSGPTSKTSTAACLSKVSKTLIEKLEATPSSYFAAITTQAYPSGAVRGQLSGTAGSGPKSVRSNAVPVSGAAVTTVTASAAIIGQKLTVTLVPGKYPFAKTTAGLNELVSDPSTASVKITLKATGARNGTGTVIVTGANNSKEPDVAVFGITWSVATGNTGTIKLTQKPA